MPKVNRKIPVVNSTSTADIAFMILLFFLLTTSMATDAGLARQLPPPIPKDQKAPDVDVNKRNILIVRINSTNQILCGGVEVQVHELRPVVREFILNEFNEASKPEKIETDIPFIGRRMITKNHVISLQNDRGTGYQAYIDVQNELAATYSELRNELSTEYFGRLFDELNADQQEAVRTVYPLKISEAEPKNYGGN